MHLARRNEINIHKIDQYKKNIEKINSNDLINEALSKIPKKETSDTIEKKLFKEELLDVKNKAISEYLNSIRDKKVLVIKDELMKQMDKYNKDMFVLVMKNKLEIKEINKKYESIREENICLIDKMRLIKKYNNDLLEQIKEYQSTLLTLQKSYSMLMKQKDLFDEIIQNFPGKSPADVIIEMKSAKIGCIEMLKSYNGICEELRLIKKNQNELDNKYQVKINNLANLNEELKNQTNEIKEVAKKKIDHLEAEIETNEKNNIENAYLRNTLYHIFNLLFEQLKLNKDIKIDKKYINVTENDFNPNFFYAPEIRSYIELMVKRLDPSSFDKMFRECIGYLNMITRNYLPDKANLRFKPVEIFREVKNFIDIKMKLIEEYKNIIKQDKVKINKLQMQINKTNENYNLLSKEYESYKVIVEKNLEQESNRNYLLSKKQKKKKKFGRHAFINSDVISNKNNLLGINSIKKSADKKIDLISVEKNKQKSTVPDKNIGEKFLSIFDSDKKTKKQNYFTDASNNDNNVSMDEIIPKTVKNKFTKLRRTFNKDKLIKPHGNQETLYNMYKINNLIDETNRLFLYKPRIMSFQKSYKSLSQNNEGINAEIVNFSQDKFDGQSMINNIEKNIVKQINGLIRSTSKKK